VRRILRYCTALLLIAGICAVECAAKKRAPRTPPDPRFLAIQGVSVLPVVDARAGQKAGVNLEKLQGQVVKTLQQKRYPVTAAGKSGQSGEIAIEDMDSADPAFIKKLGPADERWVLVVFLNDITSKITFGSTGNAELSAYLFDKGGGALLWKGKGVGQAGQGGLMGMPLKGMMKGQALDAAVVSLLAGIPNRPKPGK
jgi:hypothetical protein